MFCFVLTFADNLYIPKKEISAVVISTTLPSNDQHGPQHEKTCLPVFSNNEDTDQPGHPRSLINDFVVQLWKVFCLILLQVKL